MSVNQIKSTDPQEFSIGPSGIRRLNKFRNRHKKAAQHKQNLLERASSNGKPIKKSK